MSHLPDKQPGNGSLSQRVRDARRARSQLVEKQQSPVVGTDVAPDLPNIHRQCIDQLLAVPGGRKAKTRSQPRAGSGSTRQRQCLTRRSWHRRSPGDRKERQCHSRGCSENTRQRHCSCLLTARKGSALSTDAVEMHKAKASVLTAGSTSSSASTAPRFENGIGSPISRASVTGRSVW